MLEQALRDLFEQQATADGPPARASVARAAKNGLAQRRRHRKGALACSLLAVGAVVAVAVSGIFAGGLLGTSRPIAGRPAASPVAVAQAPAPTSFNPRVPYASFGWLPPGESLRSGGSTATSVYLNAYAGKDFMWQLLAYPADVCRYAASRLSCSARDYPITAPAPAVNGHRAFWVSYGSAAHNYLIWQYAPGGWAELTTASASASPSQTIIKVASGVSFGGRSNPPIKFAVQLTKVPGWHLTSTYFTRSSGELLATQYNFCTANMSCPAAIVTTSIAQHALGGADATGASSCKPWPGSQSDNLVIHGYQVIGTQILSGKGASYYGACAPDADGVRVAIAVDRPHPAVPPVTLFRHLRLLGPNPANWATQPIG